MRVGRQDWPPRILRRGARPPVRSAAGPRELGPAAEAGLTVSAVRREFRAELIQAHVADLLQGAPMNSVIFGCGRPPGSLPPMYFSRSSRVFSRRICATVESTNS